jgi:hypothetical protein
MAQKQKSTTSIESVLHEERIFPPKREFSQKAHINTLAQYREWYEQSIADPEKFWGERAKEELVWFKPWNKVLQWQEPFAKWFVGGELNVSHNCLDRHLGTATANKAALIWEGEPAAPGNPGEERTLTYKQLHHEVCLFANVLKRNGVGKGDRVLIYLPMVPEAAIAMLACTRVGAVHSVVFGGFSGQSVADRIHDSQAKLVMGRPDRPAKVDIHAPDPTSPGYEPNPTPEQAGCPEGNWRVVDILDDSTDWTAANLVITDSEGVVQVDKSYACTTIFRDYVGVRVDCEEV